MHLYANIKAVRDVHDKFLFLGQCGRGGVAETKATRQSNTADFEVNP